MPSSFFRQAVKHPRTTGAVAPSSKKLSREIASLADRAECVIELGAGTGSVTAQLAPLRSRKDILVVELNEDFAQSLKAQFPSLEVLNSAAHDVLDGIHTSKPVVVVSSIPFRVLPKAMRHVTVQSVLDFLQRCPHSRLVQYTYGVKPPFEVPVGFEWKRVRWVIANVPPACIWALRALKPKTKAFKKADAFEAAGFFDSQ